MNLVRQIQTSHSLANVQIRPCCDFVPHKYSGKYGTKLRPVIVKLCHQYIFRYIQFVWIRQTCVQILTFCKWRGFNADIHQIWCNKIRPIYSPQHISDVQYSWFLCCTKFLFSVLYKIPFFSDVQYSWFQSCTILLFSVMYNIPEKWHDVPNSCMACST